MGVEIVMTIKFAWLPVVARTWRPSPTKAIVWMQAYGVDESGVKSVRRLGFFSYEYCGSFFRFNRH